MNPLVKAGLLGLLNYLVYTYLILPFSIPSHEELREEEMMKKRPSDVPVDWDEGDFFWLIQISDLHISQYIYPDLQDDLHSFLENTVEVVKPMALLVSGDLTDAKEEGGVGSGQQREEWEAYREILRESNIGNRTVYLDIRGNHDTFDVPDYNEHENLYKSHSKMGPTQPSSYLTTLKSRSGKQLSIVAMDASLNPGPKKVYNFLGHLTDMHLSHLADLKAEAEVSEHQLYFGHFPISCIVPSSEAKGIVSGGLAYLSGHLHTLGGLTPKLYTIHRSGTPELELGDWKENRMWRLLAVDNGLLSFSDQRHGEGWPVVMVTNPKSASMIAPAVEMVDKILASHLIRVLVFSVGQVTEVKVAIDSGDWTEMNEDKEQAGVYTAPWEPQDYAGAAHIMKVVVNMVDDFGEVSSKEVSQKFVVDEESLENPEYSLYARLILMADVSTFLQCSWILAALACILPPAMARLAPEKLADVLGRDVVLRLRLFTSNNFLLYAYCLTALWVTFGPWHVGEILSGHIGYIFAWGTVVRGTVLPSFYPYIFSIFHLLVFHLPLLCSLLYKMELRSSEKEESRIALAISNIPITIVLSMQACLLLLLFLFPSKLGIFKEIAIFLAPMEIITIIIGFSLNGVVSYKIRDGRRTGRRF